MAIDSLHRLSVWAQLAALVLPFSGRMLSSGVVHSFSPSMHRAFLRVWAKRKNAGHLLATLQGTRYQDLSIVRAHHALDAQITGLSFPGPSLQGTGEQRAHILAARVGGSPLRRNVKHDEHKASPAARASTSVAAKRPTTDEMIATPKTAKPIVIRSTSLSWS